MKYEPFHDYQDHERREVVLPFSGFYNSIHSDELDRALENIFSDDCGNPIKPLVDRAFNLVDWRSCHSEYAEKYTEALGEAYGIKNLRFLRLMSPKYYNFETDRILAEISVSDIKWIADRVDDKAMKVFVKEHFTSCDGFISHYSGRLEDWEPLETWDHNQLWALLSVYCDWVSRVESTEESFNIWREHSLMGEGEIAYKIISNNFKDCDETQKIFRVLDYLRTREQRQHA